MITFDQIRHDSALATYLSAGNAALGEMGYTEHGFAHARKVSNAAAQVLSHFGAEPREVELARIAGYMHDIGNMVNRDSHALTGAVISFKILTDMGMEPREVAQIVTAIGNHDEGTGRPVSRVAAALFLADKSDVRRSRVRSEVDVNRLDDIHDRVNYAVTQSDLIIEPGNDTICLKLIIDTDICPVIEYFKIFMERMFMCKGACEFLGGRFSLVINDTTLM